MDGTDREGSTHSSGPKDRTFAVEKSTETGIVYHITYRTATEKKRAESKPANSPIWALHGRRNQDRQKHGKCTNVGRISWYGPGQVQVTSEKWTGCRLSFACSPS